MKLYLLFFSLCLLSCVVRKPTETLSSRQQLKRSLKKEKIEEEKLAQLAQDSFLNKKPSPIPLKNRNSKILQDSSSHYILNGSFEKFKGSVGYYFRNLEDWNDLEKFEKKSPPNWHKFFDGNFEINRDASEGDAFLSMVVREDGSYEGIYQFMNSYLIKNDRYQFSIDISHSDKMMSPFPLSPSSIPYNGRAALEIAFMDTEKEIIHIITSIYPEDSENWEKQTIEFVAPCFCDVIILSTQHIVSKYGYYNGNILIDNISDIQEVSNKD